MPINSITLIVNGRTVAMAQGIEVLDVPRNQLETTQQVAPIALRMGRSRNGVRDPEAAFSCLRRRSTQTY
jgi:hypothetical protein